MTEPGFEPGHFTPEPEKTLIASAGRATDSGPQSRQTAPRWERPLFWVRSSGKMRCLYLFHGFFVTLCPSWKVHCAAGKLGRLACSVEPVALCASHREISVRLTACPHALLPPPAPSDQTRCAGTQPVGAPRGHGGLVP